MTKQKHACPNTASKLYQGTGKKVLDRTAEKTTGTNSGIITGIAFSSTPDLRSHLETFDLAERTIFDTTLWGVHYDIVHTILSTLRQKGVLYSSLEGESLQITIRFFNTVPEDP